MRKLNLNTCVEAAAVPWRPNTISESNRRRVFDTQTIQFDLINGKSLSVSIFYHFRMWYRFAKNTQIVTLKKSTKRFETLQKQSKEGF